MAIPLPAVFVVWHSIAKAGGHLAFGSDWPELGKQSVGSGADIAVFEMLDGNFGYRSSGSGRIKGDRKLQCVMTLFGGEIYDHPYGLSIPLWEGIPKDSRYWMDTDKQKWCPTPVRIGVAAEGLTIEHVLISQSPRRQQSNQPGAVPLTSRRGGYGSPRPEFHFLRRPPYEATEA